MATDFMCVLRDIDVGELVGDLGEEVEELRRKMFQHAEQSGEATGKLVLTLTFKAKREVRSGKNGGEFDIKEKLTPTVKVTVPKAERVTGYRYLTADGAALRDNPRQKTLDFAPGPRAVDEGVRPTPEKNTRPAGGGRG